MLGLRLFRSPQSPLLSSVVKSRSFGAAVQIQYDDDYDYYGEYYDDHRKIDPTADNEGGEIKRGVQWVVIGEAGAKRHFYAEWLSKLLEVPHISMAKLVRQQLHPRSSLYKQIENYVSRGMLVPEDVIFGLLSKRLEEGYFRGETGFILDGIPRTRNQAEILDEIVDIDLVLNLKCTDRLLLEKQLQSGLKCQSLGSQIKLFSDLDRKEKLCTYAQQSKPLEDYYRKQKKLVDFQISEGLGERETLKGLLSVLQLDHMDSSLQKLSA